MRLKRPNEDGEYDTRLCAATRCREPSSIIISTQYPRYGLCDEHWFIHCDEKTEEWLNKNQLQNQEE